MPEEANQLPDKPKHTPTSQGARRTGRKQVQEATSASPPMQEAVAPLAAPSTIDSATPQALPTAVASAQRIAGKPPIGERWGEFPPGKRQVELKQRLEAWDQEGDHGNRPGPFARFELSGADVYWLATFVAGKGDVAAGE